MAIGDGSHLTPDEVSRIILMSFPVQSTPREHLLVAQESACCTAEPDAIQSAWLQIAEEGAVGSSSTQDCNKC